MRAFGSHGTWYAYVEEKPMTEAENETIARRVIEAIFNSGNLDVADELFAPGFIGHQPGDEPVNGPQGEKELAGMYRTAFPDL